MAVRFAAMASPCEVLVSTTSVEKALAIGSIAAREAWRIEAKFSRYRADSVLTWIHSNADRRLMLDSETAALLDFARNCHEISEGRFDVTSGILRRAWTFDGSDRIPDLRRINELLPFVGFDKLFWDSGCLTLPVGMQIDFGGVAKEYAVDRACELIAVQNSGPFLVNFGGDLRAQSYPTDKPWQIGLERPDTDRDARMILELKSGAMATSGDSRRFLKKNGIRYGHILDPMTGWPVADAPRSVTVAASSCTEAGLLATLAMLSGYKAEEFLRDQCVEFWVSRESDNATRAG